MMRIILVLLGLFLMQEHAMAAKLTLSSPVIQSGGSIPSHYTCDGNNISPPLQWAGVPAGTQSLALICEDPDIPLSIRADGMFDHWVLYNIPPSVVGLTENVNDLEGAQQGQNTSGKLGYYGPCPPDRQHRYFFKLYALNAPLNLPDGATKAQVLTAMDGHVLDQAELMAVYDRKR